MRRPFADLTEAGAAMWATLALPALVGSVDAAMSPKTELGVFPREHLTMAVALFVLFVLAVVRAGPLSPAYATTAGVLGLLGLGHG